MMRLLLTLYSLILLPQLAAAWSSGSTRRRLLLASIFGTTTATGSSVAKAADSTLFRPNALTNPILEQFRIWDQDYADNIKYGGELERGDAGNKGKVDAYPKLLVPILEMSNDLDAVMVAMKDRSSFPTAIRILQKPRFQKTEFKRIFNAFADNIYFSDPDRANVYLAGGATPKTEQSLAYLLRNDILTNVEDLLAELVYLEKSKEEDTTDAKAMIVAATSAMQKYLSIVPPNELEEARRYLQRR